MAMSEDYYEAVEKRIEWLTLAVGFAGMAFAAARWGWHSGLGVGVGALIAWLNFRWLQQGVGALFTAATAQPGTSQPETSRWVYLRIVGRLALLVAAVCVIFKSRWLPGRAVLAGLFSVIAAVLVEVGYEVATGFKEPGAGAAGGSLRESPTPTGSLKRDSV